MQVETYEVKEWIKGNAPASIPNKTPAANTSNPAEKPTTKPADNKSAEALLLQGQNALFAKDYKAARDAFQDAASIAPRNPRTNHGLAVAEMFLGDFNYASTCMERALVAAAGKPDRALLLNNAMLQIGVNNPMRSAKFLKEYLEGHEKDLDEPMLNALGASLYLAEDSARKAILFNQAADYYVKYQKLVEATRPGMKRWGTEWFSSGEVDKKMAEMRQKLGVADQIGVQLDQLEAKVADARRKYRQKQQAYSLGMASNLEMTMAANVVSQQIEEYNKVAVKYDEAMDKVVRPVFPKVLTPVALDDITPPATGATSLASADPTYQEAMTKALANAATKKVIVQTAEEPKAPVKPVIEPPPPVAMVAIKTDKVQKVRVTQYAAAFAVSDDLVVAPASPLEDAVEFELQTIEGASIKAELVRKDEKTGLALLRVGEGKKFGYLPLGDVFAGGTVVCVCFPTVNLFNPAAELLNGTSGAPKEGWTIRLSRHPRLQGSPILAAGKLVGVVMAGREVGIDQLPTTGLDAIKALVGNDAGKGLPARDPTNTLLQLVAVREVAN